MDKIKNEKDVNDTSFNYVLEKIEDDDNTVSVPAIWIWPHMRILKPPIAKKDRGKKIVYRPSSVISM
jgi:hypothetical protein